MRQSGTSIEQVYQAFKAAGTTGEAAFRSLSSQVLSTNIQLKETHSLLDKMATTMANTVKWNAASAAVNGMTRSVEQAWGYVKSLDTSLNNIRIVTGKSADEMANFAVQANNAAKELGKTTTDYTNASLIYAQQGLNDKEIAERAAITLKAANVTGQSTDAVSEQLTAVWNGYKVTAEEAELYVDRLAAVAATTASDLEELSTGMSKVASAAATMGVSEEQLAAQLSTIISVTREAPETIGTSLKTVYARISDIQAGLDEDGVTLGNYSGKMAEFGINVLDANGNLRDMGEVIEEIGGKWGDLSREQQVYLTQTMAGQRQYSRLMALFDNFEQYNEALATAQNAAGALQDQQDIYMQSTAAHLQVLKASVEDIYDSLADTDSINGLIDGLSTAATFVAQLVDGLGGGGAVLRSLGAIGVTVFSEQIAKGINTTITNLEIARENAQQFDQALEATREWQGIPNLDEVSKKLLDNREQLLDLARLMSPEQFTEMQSALNEMTEAYNEVGKLGTQEEILDGMIKAVTKATDKWEGLNQVLRDSDAQEEVIKRISKQEAAFYETATALDNYSKKLKGIGNKMVAGDEVTKDLEQMRNSLTSYMSQVQELADSGQMERHKEAVAQLGERLRKLPDDLPEDQLLAELELIAGALKGMTSNAGNAAAEIRQKLETEFQGTAESITAQAEAAEQKAEGMATAWQSSIDKIARAATIENFAKMAGGIASVGAAIQQVQNLGSIWKNEDLTTGQKLLQAITNLAISVPMLVSGFTKAATALKLMEVATYKDATAAAAAITANGAHAVSLGALGVAAEGATIKIQLLNTVIELNPFVAVAAAVIAFATALGIAAEKAEQARKASLDHSKAVIDEENAIQDELESHRDLYDALEDLNEAFQNNEISRTELKAEVESLIDQYDLEESAVNRLKSSYNDLTGAIRQQRIEDAQRKAESAQNEFNEAQNAVVQTAKGSGKFYSGGSNTLMGKGYNLSFDPGMSVWDEPEEVKQALLDLGFIPLGEMMGGSGGDLTKLFDTADSAEIVETYHDIQAAIEDLNKVLDEDTRNASEYYLGMTNWLSSMKDIVAEYETARDEVEKNRVELEAWTNEDSGQLDFTNVDNAISYLQQR